MGRIHIKVKDFGPISSADIELKPLTIFIGKNNTGKSTLARLIYVVTKEVSRIFDYGYTVDILPIREALLELLDRKLREKEGERKAKILEEISLVVDEVLRKAIEAVKSGIDAEMRKRIVGGKDRENVLERYFSTKASDLVNLHSNQAEIEIEIEPSYLTLNIYIKKSGNIEARTYIKTESQLFKELSEVVREKGVRKEIEGIVRMLFKRSQMLKTTKYDIPLHTLIDNTASEIALMLFGIVFRELSPGSLYNKVYYIPDGRAGLIDGYEVVSSALMSLTPIAPLRGITVPPMTGIAVEFYNTLLSLKGKRGYYAKIVDEKFAEILGGRIIYEKVPPLGRPRLTYSFSFKGAEASISLLNAASMVKELAPIYLISRELARRGDLLIIEEPEAHLHPSAQVKLAELLAILVNNGLNVLITTHSDIFLSKIANIIYKGKEASGAGSDVSLREDQVAVYLLRENDHGYIVEKVDILEKMPTFDEVIDQLYEEEKEIYIARLSKRSS